jgi:diguanylate cyclase
MIEHKEWVSEEVKARHAGYNRIIGAVSWLFIALVSLYINLLHIEPESALRLGVCCLALLSYRCAPVRFLPHGRLRGTLDLATLLLFIVGVCWFTGKTASPFVCGIYLILMATSLTLGRRVTYLMAAFAIASYTLLALAQATSPDTRMVGRIVELFPFLLFAHLGALLAGEAETARAEVEKLSLTDDLTDLHNMRSFEALALQMEKLSKRYQKPYSICMLDADNLKEINDRHGHLAGTQLIKWTARIIEQKTRECDVAARFGGDEFIIMYDGHDKEQILPAVERIVQAMAAAPFPFEGSLVSSTLSAGIASYPADGADLRSVIMRADQAMYLSKRLGKNRTSLYAEEEVRKSRGALQVGGEQLGRSVPDLDRKRAAVHLGERDFPGEVQGSGATLLK